MDVLDVIGDFGRYQGEALAIFLPRTLLCSFTFHIVHVSSTDIEYWCKPPAGFGNLSQVEWKECCLPKSNGVYGRCQRYEGSHLGDVNNSTLLNCYEWDYDGDVHSSMKSEWDLVCDRKWLLSQLYAMFFFGNLVSYPIAGFLADRVGRKTVVIWGCFGLLFTNTALYFIKSLKWFLVIRFLSGLPYTLIQSGTITHFIEIAGQKKRPMIMLFTGTTWSLFNLVLLGISMETSNWRTVVLIASFPVIIPYIVVSWRFLQESPRWLVANGKLEKAREVLILAAKKNGITINDIDSVMQDLYLKVQKGNEEEVAGGILDFLKDKRLLGILVLFAFTNFVNQIASSGFIIALRSLGGSFHTNYLLTSVVGAFVSCINSYILTLINKRQVVLTSAFAASGVLYLVTTGLGKDLQWLRIGVAMLARVFSTVVLQTLDLYENELFPTKMRSRGFNLCMMAGRAGALCSAYIDLMSQVYGPNSPYYLFGGVCLLTAVAYLFVPNMDNKVLPDSVVETKRNLAI